MEINICGDNCHFFEDNISYIEIYAPNRCCTIFINDENIDVVIYEREYSKSNCKIPVYKYVEKFIKNCSVALDFDFTSCGIQIWEKPILHFENLNTYIDTLRKEENTLHHEY